MISTLLLVVFHQRTERQQQPFDYFDLDVIAALWTFGIIEPKRVTIPVVLVFGQDFGRVVFKLIATIRAVCFHVSTASLTPIRIIVGTMIK
jgi:hypothetical protein